MKKLHCEGFKAANFPPGELPTKRQVIERMLIFPDFRTLSAARKLPINCMTDGYGAMSTHSTIIPLQLKYRKQ